MANKLKGDDVALPLLRSKSYDDSEMDITPMIDMTFLLLIFFVVTSKMDSGAGVELPQAKYGKAIPSKNAIVLTIAAGEEGKALVYKGNGVAQDKLIPAGNDEAQEAEVADFIEQELATGDKQHLLIKAAKGLKHGEVSRIARAATRSEDVQQLYVAILEL